MSAHFSSAFAHLARRVRSGIGILQGVCLAGLVAGSAFGQADAASDGLPPALAMLQDDAVKLLQDADPVVRGEAALLLGATGDFRYYEPILKVARDQALPARLRGIVALGYLAAPGAESFLGNLLLQYDRRQPELPAAALALGLMPDDHPKPAVHTYLRMAHGAYRRHRDGLASWLVGLAQEAHPSHNTVLLAILTDASNKEPDLRRLSLDALSRSLDGLERADLASLLDSSEEEDRLGALKAIRDSGIELHAAVLGRLPRVASHDRSPAVRAQALQLLTDRRQANALTIGVRAVRSGDPREVAAGIRAAQKLGGGAIRAAMETLIVDARKPKVQAAMLRAYDRSSSPEFLEQCLHLASDRRVSEDVRVQAAALAARSGEADAKGVLRALFAEVESPAQLRDLARVMYRVDPGMISPETLFAPSSARDVRLLPARAQALLATPLPGVVPALREALRSKLDDRTKGELLRALRLTAIEPMDHELTALLPRQLRELF